MLWTPRYRIKVCSNRITITDFWRKETAEIEPLPDGIPVGIYRPAYPANGDLVEIDLSSPKLEVYESALGYVCISDGQRAYWCYRLVD